MTNDEATQIYLEVREREYAHYDNRGNTILLDGNFTIIELRAFIIYMEENKTLILERK